MHGGTAWLGVFFVILTFHLSTVAAGSSPDPEIFEKNSIIKGKIAASDKCAETTDKRRPDVWLSVGKILLYQVEVPLKGNFTFHVLPGKYDLLVTNSLGCIDSTVINVEPKQVAQVDLKLQRAPAAVTTTKK